MFEHSSCCIKGLLQKLTIFVLNRDFKKIMAESLNIVKSIELISLNCLLKKATSKEKEINLLSARLLELSRFPLYHKRNEFANASSEVSSIGSVDLGNSQRLSYSVLISYFSIIRVLLKVQPPPQTT